MIWAIGGAHNLFAREYALERLRASGFPTKPSRTSATFAFERLDFALAWNRNVLGELVYPVTLADAQATVHRGDIGLLDFGPVHSFQSLEAQIRRYWNSEIDDAARVEVLAPCDLVVAGSPMTPTA